MKNFSIFMPLVSADLIHSFRLLELDIFDGEEGEPKITVSYIVFVKLFDY